MLGNLVNFQDVKSVLKLANRSEFLRVFRILTGRRETRARKAWRRLASTESSMWDVPAVQNRWRHMVTGNGQIDFYEYFFTRYIKKPP